MDILIHRQCFENFHFHRIEKSVNADELKHKIEDGKFSAVETVQILKSIKNFWKDLDYWRFNDKENELPKFVVADLCRFSSIYIQKLIKKFQVLKGTKESEVYKIPAEFSVTVASINFVAEKIQLLAQEVITNKVTDRGSIQKILGNTQKSINQKVQNLIESTVKKCIPMIRELVTESYCEHDDVYEQIDETLGRYVEDALLTLRNGLKYKEYEAARAILWRETTVNVLDIILANCHHKDSSYTTNLEQNFTLLKLLFRKCQDDAETKKIVIRINYYLECYGQNTSRLIHKYYRNRYEMQQQVNVITSAYGTLTVNCHFMENILSIQIVRTNDLMPTCPFQKYELSATVSIMPEKYFQTCQNSKIKINHQNQGEILTFKITQDQRDIKDAIVYFCFENKVRIGNNECIAEAFLSFSDIPELAIGKKVREKELPFTRLHSDGKFGTKLRF